MQEEVLGLHSGHLFFFKPSIWNCMLNSNVEVKKIIIKELYLNECIQQQNDTVSLLWLSDKSKEERTITFQ